MPTAPSAEGRRYLIAGIDTGKASAVACLGLDGTVVMAATERHGGLSWFVSVLSSAGIPVVIATDKRKADETVSKLAAIFDAVLFSPDSEMGVKRKNEFTAGAPVRTTHERDALSAAKVAYNAYRNKLGQAERLAARSNFGDSDRLKAMVIRKYSVHEVVSGTWRGRRLVRR